MTESVVSAVYECWNEANINESKHKPCSPNMEVVNLPVVSKLLKEYFVTPKMGTENEWAKWEHFSIFM